MEQDQQSQNFVVNLQGETIICSKKLINMSTFLHNILFLGFQDEQEIYIQLISKTSFLYFIQFCQINNYQQPAIISPIKTNLLQEVVNKVNFQFIQKFQIKSEQLINLLKAAQFLGCRGLIRLIAAKFACLIYFQDSKQSFQNKGKQLGIQAKIQYADDQKFRKLFPFMNA